jgi:F0F1-type ATP synthase alpha subunit
MTSQFIGPLSSSALSELNRNTGGHNSLSYDDFSKHAIAYRQLCLYLRKPAGREAFPSDVFYLHARILERSCCLSHFSTLGTMMSLPVIETLSNDLSAYIATNVISITDGQLYLDVSLFGTGICPAISTDKSVSRVGAKSLDPMSRAYGFRIYSLLGDVKQESESAVKSDGAKLRAHRSSLTTTLFIQRIGSDRLDNSIVLLALTSGSLDSLPRVLTNILALSLLTLQSPHQVLLSSSSTASLLALTPTTLSLARTILSATRYLIAHSILSATTLLSLSSVQPTLASRLLSSISWLSSQCTPTRFRNTHQGS